MITINGIRVFVNPLCETLKAWHTVERDPIQKRRRQWFVQRNERREPCAYSTPHGIYMHPTLYEKLCAPQVPQNAEPAIVGWLFEDELPDNYPYDAMFPYSKVDGVRMFPVFAPPAPQAEQPRQTVGLTDERWQQIADETGYTIPGKLKAAIEAAHGIPAPKEQPTIAS